MARVARVARDISIFRFFTLEEDTIEECPRAICNQCGAKVKRCSSSTTGMKLHLQRAHWPLYRYYIGLLEEEKRRGT